MLKTRYFRILYFFAWVIVKVIVCDLIFPAIGLGGYSRRTRSDRYAGDARRFRLLAIDMGGVMIKVGQFLSTRLDVLPESITSELSGLQDEVKEEAFADIKYVVEKELRAPLDHVFSWFDEKPLASASIGQVHRAKLNNDFDENGDLIKYPPVVVKVQRPNIDRIIETDLSALRMVVKWVHMYKPIRKHVNVPALLEELSQSIHEEIDYIQEGKNAEIFAQNFADDEHVLIPDVYWESTTRRVITLEDVMAIKITDYKAIEAAGIDTVEVATCLFNTYMKQIFKHRFFHADPHPGNLFVKPVNSGGEKSEWKLVFVDFGMVGEIPDVVEEGLREFLIAGAIGDPARAVRAEQKLNFLLPGADLDRLEVAYQRLFEEFWGKSTREMVNLSQEDALRFMNDFKDVLFELPFQIPEDFILLGRCLSILSGICTGLNENFNVWNAVMPFAKDFLRVERSDGKSIWVDEIINLLKTLARLPIRADQLINRMEQGKLEIRSTQISRQLEQISSNQQRIMITIILAVCMFAGIEFYIAEEWLLVYFFSGASLLTMLALLIKK